ncbi:uncharacterized protein BKA78DRAFT_380191 [Phyllosticta capitalensis]|uniref:uncharacterized protein n=1 Tax=Phyllosticta capitalensis TaxID=121624 RepID=UPI003130F5B6
MPTRSDKRHLYIELRSGSGHNRHRFVRRHSTSQTPTKKADSNNHHQPKPNPMRLGWSFSIATSSEQPSHAPPTKKPRKRRATTARATSEAETEKAPETCRRTDAVRVDHRGAPDVFGSWGWGCVRDWRAMGDEDEDVSVDVGERRRRRRGHHHHHRHGCPCRPLRPHLFYQPTVLFDNSQTQNNYYAGGECRPESAHQDIKYKDRDDDNDVQHLLPHLDRLSLANGHDERPSSPPPAYSDVCPRETDTPFVDHVADAAFVAGCHQVHDELDGFGRVQDWLLH